MVVTGCAGEAVLCFIVMLVIAVINPLTMQPVDLNFQVQLPTLSVEVLSTPTRERNTRTA